ncbi:MAG: hypothetical protein Q8J62_04630 [Candidatus Cloacimonadaceae bacterium]|nr:hypothetical protein [Candidatus Cloacimonadaceae bacterium]
MLKFGYSNRDDRIQVQVSQSGGGWQNLSTPVSRYNGNTGWERHTISLASYHQANDLRISLLGISAYGNDIYLDDLKVATVPPPTGWLTVNDTLSVMGLLPQNDPPHQLNIKANSATLAQGMHNAQINIYSNDMVNWHRMIPVEVIVGLPGIQLQTSSLNYGNVITGTNSTLHFTLAGTGSIGVNGTITTPAGYSVVRTYDPIRNDQPAPIDERSDEERNTLSYHIGAMGFGNFLVTFAPTAVQSYDGNIVISFNAQADIQLPVHGNGVSIPQITTAPAAIIKAGSATCGGNVISAGGLTITQRGLCWSYNPNPTMEDNHAAVPGTTGSFTYTITGLAAPVQYYVRAYAINSAGFAYGNEQVFTTLSPQLTISTNTLDLGYVPVESYSEPASFTISGINLFEPVLIILSPFDGFSLSLSPNRVGDRNNYELYLDPVDETLPETTVYVRLFPTITGVWSDLIQIHTPGTAEAYYFINSTGTGVATPLVVNGIPFAITQSSAMMAGLVSDDGQ